jgi:hypothetical protein
MRLRITAIFLLITFFASHIKAQSLIALSMGISTDVSNKKPFYSVPVTFRLEPFKHSGFFIEATQGIGFNRLSKADAYTANADLIEHVTLTEAVKNSSFSMGIGGAIVLYTNKKNNQITLNISTGICSEHYTVNFRNYDKANYEVLNPDVNENISGLYAAIAVAYNFDKRKRDMFIMLRLQSPSSAGFGRYQLSFDKAAPLQLTYGYKLFTSKK